MSDDKNYRIVGSSFAYEIPQARSGLERYADARRELDANCVSQPITTTITNPKSKTADEMIAGLERAARMVAGPLEFLPEGKEVGRVSKEAMEHPLFPIFVEAIEQAMHGKGERHGGNVTPFLEQPWVHYVKMHGRGFATGQSAKKLEEAASTRAGDPFDTEVLGAIVYAGMAILKNRGVV